MNSWDLTVIRIGSVSKRRALSEIHGPASVPPPPARAHIPSGSATYGQTQKQKYVLVVKKICIFTLSFIFTDHTHAAHAHNTW